MLSMCWNCMLSMTFEPYDIQLQLTLPLEFDCTKRNLRKHSVSPNNWTTFSISTTTNSSKRRPTPYDAKLLCATDGMSTRSSTSESIMPVTGDYVRPV